MDFIHKMRAYSLRLLYVDVDVDADGFASFLFLTSEQKLKWKKKLRKNLFPVNLCASKRYTVIEWIGIGNSGSADLSETLFCCCISLFFRFRYCLSFDSSSSWFRLLSIIVPHWTCALCARTLNAHSAFNYLLTINTAIEQFKAILFTCIQFNCQRETLKTDRIVSIELHRSTYDLWYSLNVFKLLLCVLVALQNLHFFFSLFIRNTQRFVSFPFHLFCDAY